MFICTLSAHITPREDGMVVIEPSHIPGLDLYTNRTNQQYGAQYVNQPYAASTKRRDHDQSTTHEPYQENRVLTPSRFRHPSQPWSDPTSPRREFGTQTGKTDQNDSASSLNGVYIIFNLIPFSLTFLLRE